MPRQKPKNAFRQWLTLSGVGLATIIIVGLALMLRAVPERVQTGRVALSSPVETPAMEELPLPAEDVVHPVQIVGPDGQPMPLPPTWTPFPTWTPRPTPTRRPGPTATPFPMRVPAPDAAGILFFTSLDGNFVQAVPVDSRGQKISESTPFPLPSDFQFYESALSPDGRYLLLMKPAMPGGFPYIFDTTSEQMWSLIEEDSYRSGRFFGWHPDNQRILFWPNIDELWLIDVVSRERTIVAVVDGPVQGASISPDGQQIVYIGGLLIEGSNIAPEAMWIVSTAGSDTQPILVFGGMSYLFRWSPDGKHILYMGGPGVDKEEEVRNNFTARGPLWLIQPDGQNPRPLAGPFLGGYGYVPAWSPDGNWVAFTGIDEGKQFGCFPPDASWPDCQFQGTGVYVENIFTGELRRLVSGVEPVWSPDGSMLAFLSDQSGALEVWTIQFDGTNLQQVTADGQPKTGVTWLREQEVQR